MISFIVIGRNEGWKLKNTFESIFNAVSICKIESFEIIYVDSNSTDESIPNALEYGTISVIRLSKYYNPAIARNVGALNSKGDILIFLDGDMELNPSFLDLAIIDNKLVKPLVGGVVVDRIIRKDGTLINEVEYHKKEFAYYKLITGGAFLIEKELWELIGGMDNRFVKSADPELGLRLAKKGFLLYCIPHTFVFHNNDKYSSDNRLKIRNLFKGYSLFSSVLMFRQNLFSKHTIKKFLLQEKTFFLLIATILIFIFINNVFIFSAYIIAIALRAKKINTPLVFIERLIFFLLRDVISLFAFILYYPPKIYSKDIPFEKLK